jgi:hypothetical protein
MQPGTLFNCECIEYREWNSRCQLRIPTSGRVGTHESFGSLGHPSAPAAQRPSRPFPIQKPSVCSPFASFAHPGGEVFDAACVMELRFLFVPTSGRVGIRVIRS